MIEPPEEPEATRLPNVPLVGAEPRSTTKLSPDNGVRFIVPPVPALDDTSMELLVEPTVWPEIIMSLADAVTRPPVAD